MVDVLEFATKGHCGSSSGGGGSSPGHRATTPLVTLRRRVNLNGEALFSVKISSRGCGFFAAGTPFLFFVTLPTDTEGIEVIGEADGEGSLFPPRPRA